MNIEKHFFKYTKRNRILKLDYLAEEWNCEIQDIVNLICENYQDFDNVKFDNLAVYLDYNDTEQWWYEYGKGFINENDERQFKRHEKGKVDKIANKIAKSQNKKDQHISVFQHDRKWFKRYNDPNSKVRASFVYLELDREGDLQKAIEDTDFFLQNFPLHEGIGIWFSGNSSVHIGIPTAYFGDPIGVNTKVCGRGKLFYNMAANTCRNIRFPNSDLLGFDPYFSTAEECMERFEELYDKTPPNDPQYVRQSLEQFDPNLFYMNSMIRMPDTLHEKTGKPKELINDQFSSFHPGNHIKPWLLAITYLSWEPQKKPGRTVRTIDVRGYDSFVIKFFFEHIADFDPDNINSAGWVHSLPSPFYEDHNPDVSVCIDPDSERFGSFRDFGNEDDNTDFVGFVSRIIKRSRRYALEYIKHKS